MLKPYFEVVLTGGPSSGKSTCLKLVTDSLRNDGYRVLVVPEIATDMFERNYPDIAKVAKQKWEYREVEKYILKRQIFERMAITELASYYQYSKQQDTIIIYDRAEADVASYLDSQDLYRGWLEHFAGKLGYLYKDPKELNESYDYVFFLGHSRDFYTTENNAVRRETLAEADEAALRLYKAWNHSNLRFVGATETIEYKAEIIRSYIVNGFRTNPPRSLNGRFTTKSF